MRRPWKRGEDVVLVVTGKYSVLGSTCGNELEDGRVRIRWADRTTTIIQGDLLVTPGDAAAGIGRGDLPHGLLDLSAEVQDLIGERDRARALAALLESQLSRIADVALPKLDGGLNGTAFGRVLAIRDILNEGGAL